MLPSVTAEGQRLAHDRSVAEDVGPGTMTFHNSRHVLVSAAWGAAGVPLLWGEYRTALCVAKFFNGKRAK